MLGEPLLEHLQAGVAVRLARGEVEVAAEGLDRAGSGETEEEFVLGEREPLHHLGHGGRLDRQPCLAVAPGEVDEDRLRVIAGGLAASLKQSGTNVGVMKPISSGDTADAQFLKHAAQADDELSAINPIYLRHPLAPSVAARIENREIDLPCIETAFAALQQKYDFVIVEGVGGIAVPIQDDFLVAHLISRLQLPVLIVAQAGLGTLNHTLLTVAFAQQFGLQIAGIVLNRLSLEAAGLAEATNPVEIEKLTNIPVIGVVPYEKRLDTAYPDPVFLADFMNQHIAWRKLGIL